MKRLPDELIQSIFDDVVECVKNGMTIYDAVSKYFGTGTFYGRITAEQKRTLTTLRHATTKFGHGSRGYKKEYEDCINGFEDDDFN